MGPWLLVPAFGDGALHDSGTASCGGIGRGPCMHDGSLPTLRAVVTSATAAA